MGRSDRRLSPRLLVPSALADPPAPVFCRQCLLCGFVVSARSEASAGAAFLDHLHALHPEAH